MVELAREWRTATRILRRTWGFTLLVVSMLALGLAVNITLFGIVSDVLLEPLPVPRPDHVMRIWSSWPESGNDRGTTSANDLADWRRLSSSFSALAAVPAIKPGGLVLTDEGAPAELRSTLVTEDFFEVLGVPPLLGRTLTDEDHEEARNRVVVLAEGFWQQRFGGDRAIVGRTIRLSGNAFEVVGVMPAHATYPEGSQLWAPLSLIPESGVPRLRQVRWLNVVGRLARGVTPGEAAAELSSIAESLAAEHPDSNAGLTRVEMIGLKESLVGDVRQALVVLYGAVGLVLLIVCANVASLMLTRAQRRRTETAVRLALGARTSHLVRASLVEAAVLSTLGGAIGLALSAIALHNLPHLIGSYLPPLANPGMDSTVVAYSLGLTILTAILMGMAPAIQGATTNLSRVLSDASRGSTAGARTMLARRGLVVLEVGIVVILAIAAGVLVRNFLGLRDIEPGFDSTNVLIVDMNAPQYRYPESEQISAFYREVCERAGAIPGVESVGVIRPVPLSPDDFDGESIDLARPGLEGEDDEVSVTLRFAGPGSFASLGIPLLDGREFDSRDGRDSPPVVVINQALAERLFPGERRVAGRRIPTSGGESVEVIGVVGNVRHRHPTREAGPAAYVTIEQDTRRGMSLAIRTSVPPMQLAAAVRGAIASVDRDQPIRTITTTEAIAHSSLGRERLTTSIISLFAVLALLIAVVGVSGTLGYVVVQRTREIGVRIALGARPSDITRLVIREGIALTAIGTAIGIGGAYGLSGTITVLVHEVRPTDPGTWIVSVAFILAAAAVASWIPARRAAALEPAAVMRVE